MSLTEYQYDDLIQTHFRHPGKGGYATWGLPNSLLQPGYCAPWSEESPDKGIYS
jgi:hypothetical protein